MLVDVWKSVFLINNHTPLLGYRISIISIRYPTIQFDLIDKVKMSIYRLSMTSLTSSNAFDVILNQLSHLHIEFLSSNYD